MANNTLTELQKAAESIREGLKTVDEDIKKLTGRDPAEPRQLPRQQFGQRIQLKRNAFQRQNQGGPVAKTDRRDSNEGIGQRRWGRTVTSVASRISLEESPKLDSSGEEEDSSVPAIHSSVVATGKPAKIERNVLIEDQETKLRNKRMFGLLLGTLQRFRDDNKHLAAREKKKELIEKKLERKAVEEKEQLEHQKRELFQTRRSKQEELKKLEKKMELAELKDDIAEHYNELQKYIRLKSTPHIFYMPAKHNDETTKLLQESQKYLQDSLKARYREMDLSDDDMVIEPPPPPTNTRPTVKGKRSVTRRVVREVREVRDPGHRDLFEEDREDELMEEGELEEGEIREDDGIREVDEIREVVEIREDDEIREDHEIREVDEIREDNEIREDIDIPEDNERIIVEDERIIEEAERIIEETEHENEDTNKRDNQEDVYENGNKNEGDNQEENERDNQLENERENVNERENELDYEGDNEEEVEKNTEHEPEPDSPSCVEVIHEGVVENDEIDMNSSLIENNVSNTDLELQNGVIQNDVPQNNDIEQLENSNINGIEELQVDSNIDINLPPDAASEEIIQGSFVLPDHQEDDLF